MKLWETLRQVDDLRPIISSVHGAVCPSIFNPQFEFMMQCVLAFSSLKFSLWCSSGASNNSQLSEQLDDYFPFLKTEMKNENLLPKEPCSFVFIRGVFIMMVVGWVQKKIDK